MMNKPVVNFNTTKSCKDLICYCPFHKNYKETAYFTNHSMDQNLKTGEFRVINP